MVGIAARVARGIDHSSAPGGVPVVFVFPRAVVFGFGLVTFVAPLTATVMGAADPDHPSVPSGVNNATARTAALAAIAVVPVVSGLSAATEVAEVTDAFRVSLVIAAFVAAAAAPLSYIGLGPHIRGRATAPRVRRGRPAAPAGPGALPTTGDPGRLLIRTSRPWSPPTLTDHPARARRDDGGPRREGRLGAAG